MKNLLPVVASLMALLPFSPVGEEMWHMACHALDSQAQTTTNQLQQWGHTQQSRYQQWLAIGKQELGQQQQGTSALLEQVEAQPQGLLDSGKEWGQTLLAQGANHWHSAVERVESTGKTLVDYPLNWWQQLASAGEESLSTLQARQEEVKNKLNRTLDRWEELPDQDIR